MNLKTFLTTTRKLVDAATPGEWFEEHQLAGGHTVWAPHESGLGSFRVAACSHAQFDKHNAAFIANARSSLPLCLTLIEKIAEALQEIADEGHSRDCAECWQAKCDCVLPVARECLAELDEITKEIK